jgi:hypothetical protein
VGRNAVGNVGARPSREVDRGRHDLCGFAAIPAFQLYASCHLPEMSWSLTSINDSVTLLYSSLTIVDIAQAVASPARLTSDEATCRRLLTLLPSVPAGGGIRPDRRSARPCPEG